MLQGTERTAHLQQCPAHEGFAPRKIDLAPGLWVVLREGTGTEGVDKVPAVREEGELSEDVRASMAPIVVRGMRWLRVVRIQELQAVAHGRRC